MSYQLTSTASILRQSDGASIPADLLNADYREFLAWVEAGNTPEPYFPPALTAADYIAATQTHLDAHAQAWGYDDLKSACTYLGDPYARFAAEALALRNWRSEVWAFLDANGSAPLPEVLPTIAEFLALLPAAPTRPVTA
jgi:hypothetical protein